MYWLLSLAVCNSIAAWVVVLLASRLPARGLKGFKKYVTIDRRGIVGWLGNVSVR